MKCTQPNCENDAALTYVWPWGQRGATCEVCLPALERTAESLGRPLPLSPVHRTEPPPPPSEGLRIFELQDALEIERGKRQSLEIELERAQEQIRHLENAMRAAPKPPPPAGESVIEGQPPK